MVLVWQVTLMGKVKREKTCQSKILGRATSRENMEEAARAFLSRSVVSGRCKTGCTTMISPFKLPGGEQEESEGKSTIRHAFPPGAWPSLTPVRFLNGRQARLAPSGQLKGPIGSRKMVEWCERTFRPWQYPL